MSIVSGENAAEDSASAGPYHAFDVHALLNVPPAPHDPTDQSEQGSTDLSNGTNLANAGVDQTEEPADKEAWIARLDAEVSDPPHGLDLLWYRPEANTVYMYRQPTPWLTRTLLLYGACKQLRVQRETNLLDLTALRITEQLARTSNFKVVGCQGKSRAQSFQRIDRLQSFDSVGGH